MRRAGTADKDTEMDMQFLKECLLVEVIGGKNKTFSWPRAVRHAWRQPRRRFIFWWRIASYMYHSKNKFLKRLASRINRNLFYKYNAEIELGLTVAPGFYIGHFCGVVITRNATIGRNFEVRQNTTIGLKSSNDDRIVIGDNVSVGAHSCIIAENLSIGDNVVIGAFSFINKDIPSNTIYYTRRESVLVERGIGVEQGISSKDIISMSQGR